MLDQPVYQDAITYLSQLMRDTFGDVFKAIYEGDPQQIPAGALPCIIIEKVNGSISTVDAPTGMDTYLEQISIRLVLDKMDDIGADDQANLTERKLRRYIEARDPVTGSFLPGTAMYAIRTNLTFGNAKIENDIDINYDIQARPQMQLTSEGLISIITKEHIIRQNSY